MTQRKGFVKAHNLGTQKQTTCVGYALLSLRSSLAPKLPCSMLLQQHCQCCAAMYCRPCAVLPWAVLPRHVLPWGVLPGTDVANVMYRHVLYCHVQYRPCSPCAQGLAPFDLLESSQALHRLDPNPVLVHKSDHGDGHLVKPAQRRADSSTAQHSTAQHTQISELHLGLTAACVVRHCAPCPPGPLL
jgi:hypothetical protein